MIFADVLNGWADSWAGFMWHRAIDSTIVFVLVGVVWLLLRKRVSAQFGYLLYLLVLLKLVIPVQIPLPGFLADFLPQKAVTQSVPFDTLLGWGGSTTQDYSVATPPHREASFAPTPDTVRITPTEAAQPAHQRPALSLQAILMLGWAAVAFGLLARLIYREYRTYRLVHRTKSFDPDKLPVCFNRLKEIARTKRKVYLRTSPWVTVPVTHGILRPVLLIPANLSEHFTPHQIRWILLHELAHITRWDTLVVLFQKLTRLLFFFHPVVCLTNRIIDRQREFICDDIALMRSGAPRRECGDGFLGIVETANGYLHLVHTSLGVLNSTTSIKSRLLRILDPGREIRPRLLFRDAVCLLIAALLLLPFAGRISEARMDERDKFLARTLGIFENSANIGDVPTPGEVKYDPMTDTYHIAGSGQGRLTAGDELFFVYRKMTGSWRIEATMEWCMYPNEFASIGLMCRESLDTSAKQVNMRYWRLGTADFVQATLRKNAGGVTAAFGSHLPEDLHGKPIRCRLIRLAPENQFIRQWYNPRTEQWVSAGNATVVEMPDEILLGLVAFSGVKDAASRVEGLIRDVKITPLSTSEFYAERSDDLGSDVHVAAVKGRRTFSDVTFAPGAPVQVMIDVAGSPGAVKVEETPPAGWTISDVSPGGTVGAGVITWNLASFTGSETLSYAVTRQSNATDPSRFSGKVGQSEIAGMNTVVSPKPVGIFENHMDMGDPDAPGDVTYNSQTGEYQVKASDTDATISVHLAYRKVTGDFSLKARVRAQNLDTSDRMAGAGLAITDSLAPHCSFYAAKVNATTGRVGTVGGSAPRWESAGSGVSMQEQDGWLEIVRRDNAVSAYHIELITRERTLLDARTIELTDPVYVGLFAHSLDPGRYTVGYFTDVELSVGSGQLAVGGMEE